MNGEQVPGAGLACGDFAAAWNRVLSPKISIMVLHAVVGRILFVINDHAHLLVLRLKGHL